MKNLLILVDALTFVEARLTEPLTQQGIADAAYCSLSNLQKLFRYAFHCSVKEYVSKRRLTAAAGELAKGGRSVTDIALRYEYGSPEAFSRAFARVWGVPPSRFRETWRFTGLFPRYCPHFEGGYSMRKVDISELYDVLRGLPDTYVLCFDIVGLTGINAISHEAGDIAIREALRRLDRAATDDMLLFRIGGDEFALVSGLRTRAEVEAFCAPILAKNGEPIECAGREFPLSLWASAFCLTAAEAYSLRYAELYRHMQDTMTHNKADSGKVAFA